MHDLTLLPDPTTPLPLWRRALGTTFGIAAVVVQGLPWLIGGGLIVASLAVTYLPAWVEAECVTVSGPTIDQVLAGYGLQHAPRAPYTVAIQAWEAAQARREPPTPRPLLPANAWKVCPGWVVENPNPAAVEDTP